MLAGALGHDQLVNGSMNQNSLDDLVESTFADQGEVDSKP